jgi:hypothetical protein
VGAGARSRCRRRRRSAVHERSLLPEETPLGSPDPVEYLEAAVAFANERPRGALSASLIAHPRTLRDPALRHAVKHAIAGLRYGTVTVNPSPAMAFAFGTPPWGAYPGSTPRNIGSGGVHNTSMREEVEKTVLRFPLTSFPKRFYFPGHRTGGCCGSRRPARQLSPRSGRPGHRRLRARAGRRAADRGPAHHRRGSCPHRLNAGRRRRPTVAAPARPRPAPASFFFCNP